MRAGECSGSWWWFRSEGIHWLSVTFEKSLQFPAFPFLNCLVCSEYKYFIPSLPLQVFGVYFRLLQSGKLWTWWAVVVMRWWKRVLAGPCVIDGTWKLKESKEMDSSDLWANLYEHTENQTQSCSLLFYIRWSLTWNQFHVIKNTKKISLCFPWQRRWHFLVSAVHQAMLWVVSQCSFIVLYYSFV